MTEKKSKDAKSQPTRRVFSVEFKAGAVKLATRPGMSVAQAAHDLGIGDTLLRA
jgi:transposase-like protein